MWQATGQPPLVQAVSRDLPLVSALRGRPLFYPPPRPHLCPAPRSGPRPRPRKPACRPGTWWVCTQPAHSAACFSAVTEVKCTVNVMRLDRPKPPPCPAPGATKDGDRCPGGDGGPSTPRRSAHLEALPGALEADLALPWAPGRPSTLAGRPSSALGLATRGPASGGAQGRWRLHRPEASPASCPPFRVRGG